MNRKYYKFLAFNLIMLFTFFSSCVPAPPAAPTLTPIPTATSTVTPAPTAPPGPTPKPGFQAYQAELELERTPGSTEIVWIRYLIYFPEAYGQDPERRWPLVLFLHGSGEAGQDLNMLKKLGLPAILSQNDMPFIMVAPQLPAPKSGTYTSPTDMQTYLMVWGWNSLIDPMEVLLTRLIGAYPIDPARVYLTGLSLGGYGAWAYALRYPTRFAALAPLAGGYIPGSDSVPERICDLKDLPIWAFHGEKDTTVLPAQSQVLIDALKECGGQPRFTLVPGGNHASAWDTAYKSQDFWDWMLSQSHK